MTSTKLLIYCGAIVGCVLPQIKADSLVIISKRYSNNSYSCYVRHTKDDLEYHLTYNVCHLAPLPSNSTVGIETIGIQCLYYECSITSTQLMAGDGQLGCFRHEYTPTFAGQSMFGGRTVTYREWPISKASIPRHHEHARVKRDFSWVTFLEKISFMGRHQSTVSKQNEAYFHYNFMNRPSGSGSTQENTRPVQVPPQAPPTSPPVQPQPVAEVAAVAQ